LKNKLWIWIAIGVVLVAIVVVGVVVFSGYHRITVVSGQQFVASCPKLAKTGDIITVETAVVSDGEIYVNGVDGSYIRPGVYQFTMPDRNVELKVTVIAYPDGA
jgi:hypothetical protein